MKDPHLRLNSLDFVKREKLFTTTDWQLMEQRTCKPPPVLQKHLDSSCEGYLLHINGFEWQDPEIKKLCNISVEGNPQLKLVKTASTQTTMKRCSIDDYRKSQGTGVEQLSTSHDSYSSTQELNHDGFAQETLPLVNTSLASLWKPSMSHAVAQNNLTNAKETVVAEEAQNADQSLPDVAEQELPNQLLI